MVDIRWIGSNNFESGSIRKVGFILHWMAGYLPGTDALFRPGGSADYATHYGIGSPDGWGTTLEVHQYVADKDRSYGSYNADADSRGLSIEIENDRRATYPGKPTPAVHELVAQFMAQKAIEHDMRIGGIVQLVLGDFPDHRYYERSIPEFGRDFNVTTHRSMALKDCPGTTDVVWIVARANQIIGGVGAINPEEGTMYPIRIDGRDVFYIAPEYLRFEKYPAGAELVKNILTADDKFHEIPGNMFPSVLAAFGVPANVPNIIRTGPVDVWSRAREADDKSAAAIAAVKGIAFDSDVITRAVNESVADAIASVAINANVSDADRAAIANKVTDTLASRLGA